MMRDFCSMLALSSMGALASTLGLHRPTIFCFHSVTADRQPGFRSRMAVGVSFLLALARDLHRAGIPVLSLPDAMLRLRDNDARAFAVLTFDDGYRDNYDILYPAMLRHGLPFTIFVTTGLVDREVPMWWDMADRLDVAGRLPAVSRDAEADDPLTLSAADLTEHFRRADPDGQRRSVARLAARHPATPEKAAYDQALSWPMLREMLASGLLTVGAHTRTHPLLGRLAREAGLAEMAMSRRRLEERLDVPIRWFAYPFGQADEIGPHGIWAARESGFEAAFTTEARPLRPADAGRPFALPRILLSAKARRSGMAVAYMSGAPAAIKRALRRASVPAIEEMRG